MTCTLTHAHPGDGPRQDPPRVGVAPGDERLEALPPAWRSDLMVRESLPEWREFTSSGDEHAVLIDYVNARGVRGWLGLGDPGRLATLVADATQSATREAALTLPDSASPLGLTATNGTWDLLASATQRRLAMPHSDSWDWLAITHRVSHDLAPAALRARVRVLDISDPADADVIQRVQAASIPDTHLKVEIPGTRWFGLVGSDGDIRAIAGATRWPDAAHLGSVGTLP